MKFATCRALGFGFICACLLNTCALADIVTFTGSDAGAGPVPLQDNRPNSDAAATSFATAALAAVPLGYVHTVDFENIPLSTPGVAIDHQEIVPGEVYLTLTGTSLSSPNGTIYGISNTPNDASTGYNTTLNGTKHLKIAPTVNVGTATVQFDFPKAINSFGAYLTGLGTATGNLSVTFNDGNPQSLNVLGLASGGVQYFGFTDANKSFQSVTLTISGVTGPDRDVFGIDDLRYAVVPEPSSFILLAFGLSSVAVLRHRRQSRARASASV